MSASAGVWTGDEWRWRPEMHPKQGVGSGSATAFYPVDDPPKRYSPTRPFGFSAALDASESSDWSALGATVWTDAVPFYARTFPC